MRLYFDTEFTQFRDGHLLSIGLVSDTDDAFYVEVDTPQRRALASDFCHQHVLPQFGHIAGAAVSSDAEAGDRIASWLLAFRRPLVLSFDYPLDWFFLEHALRCARRWEAVAPVVSRHDIAAEANHEWAIAAQEAYLKQARHPGRHHALVDAHALRERWREHLRLSGTGTRA